MIKELDILDELPLLSLDVRELFFTWQVGEDKAADHCSGDSDVSDGLRVRVCSGEGGEDRREEVCGRVKGADGWEGEFLEEGLGVGGCLGLYRTWESRLVLNSERWLERVSWKGYFGRLLVGERP